MKTNKAFTLIEVLVVTAILAILAGTLFLALSKIKERTNQKKLNVTIQLEQETKPPAFFKVNDVVVINGINKTSVVNYVFCGGLGKDSVTVITSDGIKIDGLNPAILHKANQ